MIPISNDIIQPVMRSNIQYVNSIDEFEAITLDCNQTILCFDNYKQCFYTRSRDQFGEYSTTKIYFYEDFAAKMQHDDNKAFYDKCKALKLDSLKTEVAYKFFMENEKPMKVWIWLLETKKSNCEYDTVKYWRCKLKKAFLSLESKFNDS